MHGVKHNAQDITLENNGPESVKMVTAINSVLFTPVDAGYPNMSRVYKRIAEDSKYTDNQFDWQYLHEANKACKAFAGQKMDCKLNQIKGMGWFTPVDNVTYIIMGRR